MREITLPPPLEVGQGYGMVRWNVRAIWENYAGWFHHRSTAELYAEAPQATAADLVELAGAESLITRARRHLADGNAVHAIQLAEVVRQVDSADAAAAQVLVQAHQRLLETSTNFWETAWLRKQIEELS